MIIRLNIIKMSNYFIVDDETGHNYGSKFNSLSKSNEDRDISDSKFVTNIRLGRITFNRPIADWDSLLCRNDSTNIKNGRSCSKSRFCCTKQRCKSYSLYCLMSILPCINTLLHYNWRSDLLKDICGGLTIGVMNIPQGMAYSLLAGLPPVYGLYVSFLSPLFYAIFGRCAQLSMGTFAVISLLIAGPIEQFSSKVELHYRNSIINTNFTNADLTMDDKLKLSVEPRLLVAITLTFLVGIMQLIIGFCQLGTLTSYLAPAMVSGYTSGSGYHVLSSQISSLFGVKAAKKYQGPGSFFWLVIITVIVVSILL
ncbi:unnamed protein product [Heterobilharzia americana]|nr:unnamed protein product [Heterobilharzia americana]